jgi:hypothetical protein
MSKVLKRFREFLSNIHGRAGALLPAWKSKTGERPPVTFEGMTHIYLRDPAARAAVDFLADQAVGMGFYTTAEVQRAKDVVDNFSEHVNLDGLLQIGAREVIAFGNSFWEKIEPNHLENLTILPITSIDKVQRDKYGRVQGYKQTAQYGGKKLEPERVIHLCWNPVAGEAFGTGILRSLCTQIRLENGETRPSFVAMKAGMEQGMTEIIKKYAGPTELWKFPGLRDDKAEEYASKIKNMPREGARFVVNVPAEVDVVTVDPRSRFEAYTEHIWNQFILGLQTPLPKLFTTPGFTEASARAAIEVAERKVMALQRFLKRIIEREIFQPVIRQAGFDPAEAEVRLEWGLPEKPDVEALLPMLADIAKDRPDVISAAEFRKILVDLGLALEKIEEEAEEEESVE